MTGLSIPNFAYPVSNVIVPTGGPKCVPAVCDFSNVGTIDIDGQSIIDTHAIEFIQGVYIDNAANAVPFSLTCNTGQTITIGPNMQGYFAILVQNPPKMTAVCAQANARKVNLIYYNVPIVSGTWKTV